MHPTAGPITLAPAVPAKKKRKARKKVKVQAVQLTEEELLTREEERKAKAIIRSQNRRTRIRGTAGVLVSYTPIRASKSEKLEKAVHADSDAAEADAASPSIERKQSQPPDGRGPALGSETRNCS